MKRIKKRGARLKNYLTQKSAANILHDSLGRRYLCQSTLGSGTYGTVLKGLRISKNQDVAIKVQSIDMQVAYYAQFMSDSDDARQFIHRRIKREEVLLKYSHQFIGHANRMNVRGEHKHYTIMKFLEGQPSHTVFSKFNTLQQLNFFLEAAQALLELHRHGFIHLDVWRNNLLVGAQTKLIDYGCALRLKHRRAKGFPLGAHTPPELLDEYEHNGFCTFKRSADVFGLGMTAYALLFKDYFEYDDKEPFDAFLKRYRQYYQNALAHIALDSSPLSQLVNTMIHPNESLRPYLRNVVAKLGKLIDEVQRLEAAQPLPNPLSQVMTACPHSTQIPPHTLNQDQAVHSELDRSYSPVR